MNSRLIVTGVVTSTKRLAMLGNVVVTGSSLRSDSLGNMLRRPNSRRQAAEAISALEAAQCWPHSSKQRRLGSCRVAKAAVVPHADTLGVTTVHHHQVGQTHGHGQLSAAFERARQDQGFIRMLGAMQVENLTSASATKGSSAAARAASELRGG